MYKINQESTFLKFCYPNIFLYRNWPKLITSFPIVLAPTKNPALKMGKMANKPTNYTQTNEAIFISKPAYRNLCSPFT